MSETLSVKTWGLVESFLSEPTLPMSPGDFRWSPETQFSPPTLGTATCFSSESCWEMCRLLRESGLVGVPVAAFLVCFLFSRRSLSAKLLTALSHLSPAAYDAL